MQPTPQNCHRVRLLPTLVHDKASDAVIALGNVMSKIELQGWPAGCVEAWSISISRLNIALLNMANRVPFSP